jgi:hypothetical protein
MKYRIIFLILLFAVFLLSARSLPKDGNGVSIQVGRGIQLYDDSTTGAEHLSENTLDTHVNWDVTNDLVDTDSILVWTWVDTAASTATQTNADLYRKVKNTETLYLTYTVTVDTLAGGSVSIWASGICDSTAMTSTAGTHTATIVTVASGADTADFVINIQSDEDVTQGVINIDNIYLKGTYNSPVTIPAGVTVTLEIPTRAVEVYIQPYNGQELQIINGSNYYSIWDIHTFPCTTDSSISIKNPGAAEITIYFFFYLI